MSRFSKIGQFVFDFSSIYTSVLAVELTIRWWDHRNGGSGSGSGGSGLFMYHMPSIK